jgi:hypothetical protein
MNYKTRIRLNEAELSALSELPFLQRCIYIFALKPFVDYATGIVGIMRRISWQSIAEQVYISPKRGIRIQQCSKDQLRRAIKQLEQQGLIIRHKGEELLVFDLCLASRPFSGQNKAARSAPPLAAREKTTSHKDEPPKATMGKIEKAATPLNVLSKRNNNLYIYAHLEKNCSDLSGWFKRFWQAYPVKISKQACKEYFLTHITDPDLFATLMQALDTQKQARAQLLARQEQGEQLFIPPWKYPLTWLQHGCWEDDVQATDSSFSIQTPSTRANDFPINADFSHIDYGDYDHDDDA